MIRNETECQEASKRLGDELKRLDEHRARLVLNVRLRIQVAIQPLPPFPVAQAS
jgi:hypothetical protein